MLVRFSDFCHDRTVSAEPPEPLNLGLLLFIPYRFLESAVLAALRAHGHDLPLSQARVFQRIAPEGSRPGELARAAQVTKQTLGSIVDQLERAGYVSRTRDPSDARARLVVLTDRGRELVELGAPVVRSVESAWEAHLGPARTRELRRSLEMLREVTDPFA
jgi:DNA-binding MarR family transcriptional regulator